MGFSVMLRGAEKLVPAEYWCPYGISFLSGLKNKIKSNWRSAWMALPTFSCTVLRYCIFVPAREVYVCARISRPF